MVKLSFDVMLGDKYVGTLSYLYPAGSPVELADLEDVVVSRYPRLRNTQYRIFFI